MNRYLIFAGDYYYPAGGWKDYQNSFGDINDAEYWLSRHNFPWWEVVDIVVGLVVLSSEDRKG